jgi:NAD(P)-dependent dehydrogenase (short-subunit alcohol dehydrogenase family)
VQVLKRGWSVAETPYPKKILRLPQVLSQEEVARLIDAASAPERERLYESVGKSLPVGRVGEAHDVAQAYLFLMQEGFSTGQTVVVDGGTVLV